MHAIGYVRVSTEEQTRSGLSLKAQESAIRGYAASKGFQDIDVVIDAGVSGSIPLGGRPAGSTLDGVPSGTQIIAWSLDRLFRDASDALARTKEWDRAGVVLHLVNMGGNAIDTATPMGRFMLTMFAAMAECERNLIRERTRQALGAKKARGEKLGGRRPFGFDVADGKLVPNDVEQRAAEDMRSMAARGRSTRTIAQVIGEEYGIVVSHSTVAEVVRRAA